jgi:hypothetical protein
MPRDLVGLREQVSVEWNRAEHAVKLAEQVNGQVVNPAIYELRYAGRKLVESWEAERSGDLDRCELLLRDAMLDCMRARHDAIDAATSKVIVHLDVAVNKLGATKVLTCFPNWAECYQHLNEVREKIAHSRGNRNDRAAIYETIEATDLPKIIALYNQFKAQEPRLKSEAKNQRWLGLSGWVVATLVGVAGLFF